MRSKGNAILMLRRIRFSAWLLVVMVLTASFMSAFQKVEIEANDSAFLVASKRIIERASFYKQKWLLQQQPSHLEIDSELLTLSQNGWVLPINEAGDIDCDYWLKVLYPDKQILESLPINIHNHSDGSHYRCDYDYGMNRHVVIDLNYKHFSAKIVLVAE
ncbi:MSHA biogenesis protein MshF [Vibrio sp. MarTm2]|uniref:MSHA biogenesis protein MshF n=1 Tax=Vibrio sp. MarTm2 TaxID=2998831 RepID=UPI0022CD57C3|nr:MSHA biogenesis protein MshF [Vibrio sp. MarTm2]MDA0128925.1 MSHA biogenesis protein MshF [Vibrio sp. MarTm2]